MPLPTAFASICVPLPLPLLALALAALSGLPATLAAQPSSPMAVQPAPVAARAAAPSADPLDALVDEAIASAARRYLDADTHTPWQIMHGLLALRDEFQIRRGGRLVNALEWTASGPTYEGRPWFEKTQWGGRAHPFTRAYAFEGHPNQFLAKLSLIGVPLDFQLQTPDGPITVADMVRHAQMEVTTRDEPTWTLWALSHYLPLDATWNNKYNQRWSIESLVRLQVNETFERAACGGTHGGFALARALDKHRQTGRPLTGVWLEADQKLRRYVETARAYQNSDGSFSSNYFQSRGSSRDFATRLQTSGHTLEFVAMALPLERYREDWFRRAVHAMARDLIDHRAQPVDVGALFHGVDGLVVYRERKRPRAVDAERLAREPDAAPPPVTTLKPASDALDETEGP